MEKSKTGRKQKRTEVQVIEAIKGSAGIKSTIIKRLDITYRTLNEYIKRYPSIEEALVNEEEGVLDMAEGNLFKLIQNGDVSAIFYFLNNKGRKRGYGNANRQQDVEQKTEEHECGVLVTPGLLEADEWERQAQK